MRTKPFFVFMVFVVLVNACQHPPEKAVFNTLPEIDRYIAETMQLHEIPGLAIAIIKHDTVIHQGFYGKASLTASDSIAPNTIFRLYSLSKLMVATSVFKLIEDGKLSLQDPLSKHFDALPASWQSVTIANLLSHSSGLPDVRNYSTELSDSTLTDEAFLRLLYDDPMDFNTGTAWSYNQTNFLLLKLVIEKASGTSFESYVLGTQFPNKNSSQVLFSSDPEEVVPNRAIYYDYDQPSNSFKIKPEFPGKRSHPLNGVNLTLDAFVYWNKLLDKDLLLQAKTKKAMWSPFNFTEGGRRFLHAWDVYEVNGLDSYGFSGGGVSGYRKFVDQDLSIIVLTNGFKHYPVQDIIIDYVAGMVDQELASEAFTLTEELTKKYLLQKDPLNMPAIFNQIRNDHPGKQLEGVFKSLGYRLFFDLGKSQEALKLFELNATEYPESYDTHGSLAYLQYLTNQFELSKKNYEKAKELNPDNSYSDRMIERLNDILKNQ